MKETVLKAITTVSPTQEVGIQPSAASPSGSGFSKVPVLGAVGALIGGAITLGKVILASTVDDDPLIKEGKRLISLGQYSDAKDRFDQAISENPNHPTAYNNRAVAFFYLLCYEDCIRDCDKQLQLCPENHKPLSNKAMAQEALTQYSEAIATWKTLLATQRKQSTFVSLGNLYMKVGGYKEAKMAFTESLKISGGGKYTDLDIESLAGRAEAKFRLGDETTTALEDIEKAITQSGGAAAEFFDTKGRILLSEGDHQNAIIALSRSIQLSPTKESHYSRAMAYNGIQDGTNAIKDLSIASSMGMLVAQVRKADLLLAYASSNQDRIAALTEASKAVQKEPSCFPGSYNTRGSIQLSLGNYSQALKDFKIAEEIMIKGNMIDSEDFKQLRLNILSAQGRPS